MSAAIALENVTKRFGAHLALDAVSLEISAGEAAVILGPSGCGKTTLLRTIAGLDVRRGAKSSWTALWWLPAGE